MVENSKRLKRPVLTPKGKDLVAKCLATVVKESSGDIEKQFKKWWEAFPSYSDHSHFKRTRKLKINRVDAFRRYVETLQEGVDPDDLLFALKKDVSTRIENSTQYRNELATIASPAKWLYQKEYESFLKTDESRYTDDKSKTYGKELF